MSALDRLARMQRELTLAVAAQCVVWAACTAVALVATFAIADRAMLLPLPLRAAMPWVAVLAGLAAAAWRFARAGAFTMRARWRCGSSAPSRRCGTRW